MKNDIIYGYMGNGHLEIIQFPQLPPQELYKPGQINHIPELYDRLNQIGYTKEYLRKYALPDWWSDEVDADPLCLTECALYIQRLTGLSMKDLITPGHPITPVPSNNTERRQVVMRDRYSAGETVEELMYDYGLEERTVEIILGIHY